MTLNQAQTLHMLSRLKMKLIAFETNCDCYSNVNPYIVPVNFIYANIS